MTSRERKSAKRSRAHKAFLAYLRESAVLVGVKRYPRTLGFTVPKSPSLMRERDANKHKITVFKGVSGRHWILDDAGEHHKHKVECIIRKD